MGLVFKDFRGEVYKHETSPSILVLNYLKNTLRGMHWQEPPADREKVFSVVSGSVRFVVLDVDCATIVKNTVMYPGDRFRVARNQAAGYLTLEDLSIVHYVMTVEQQPGYERGIRWDDPHFRIDWQTDNPILNLRDASWPDFVPGGK